MSIESLKEQARRHEQKEEWRKALDLYSRAIGKLAEEDQPDIGLYNRAGDLCVRIGDVAGAVRHYEQAVDLYLEAELPNNAIAICKKVIRNLPNRHATYLKMGQIRAQQGFLPDARANFLTYAERMQQVGDLDESFRALVEFADLAPDDVDIRLAVAEQMASNERPDDAVDQFAIAHRALMLGGDDVRASEIEGRIREIKPDADLSTAGPRGPGGMVVTGNSLADDAEIVGSFGEIAMAGEDEPAGEGGEEEEEPLPTFGYEGEEEGEGEALPTFGYEGGEEEEAESLPTFDHEGEEEEEGEALPAFDHEDEEEEGEALPTYGFEGEEDEEEEAGALPTYGFEGEEDEEEEEEEPLPTYGFEGEEEEEESEPAGLDAAAFGVSDDGDREGREYVEPESEIEDLEVEADLTLGDTDRSEEAREGAFEEAAADAGPEATLDEVRAEIEERPDDVALRQRMVELAYREGDEALLTDAYLGLAGALRRMGQAARANAAYQQVLDLDPDNEIARGALRTMPEESAPVREVASSEDYVDLGSLVLGDEGEKTTRFVVAYEEPSGDEQADFAKMLTQFKEKVSENLDVDDVRAHHDLGTAYKEMGLLDEAVAEFQQALRASANHLPTYEILGQTFLEMGKGDAAVRSLKRALEMPFEVEDELVGIYYYLARAYELIGNKEAALEYYDQVFSLDINFADVTERLRALR